MASRQEKIDSLRRYTDLIRKQTGRVVRPYRMDGYVNLLTKYGTSRDSSERYEFKQEPPIPDDELTMFYEGNGLFSKIIDAPAEEAIKHGFELKDVKDQEIEDFYMEALDELDWEETAMTCIKWARLFGGSIAVLMINDGRGVDEPLDWRNIKSIDDIRVYDRSLIQPDYSTMFSYDPDDPFGTRGSRLGMPEYYDVFSKYGNFRVHDSRCLVFQNGILPENTSNSYYQLWGMPEYVRLKKAIRDAEIAHGTAPKMLDRSIQAVYSMKDLSAELATEEGEDRVLRRLQTIDMARGLLNSITIDSEGEDYSFRQFSFTGVSEVIDTTCNFLSALTSIPQTILFGRSPAGMNSTGMGDLENWYNYVERIQKRMLKKNLRYLLSIIFQAGVLSGEIDEVPPIKVEFNPLWSLSEQEEVSLDQMRAQVENTKANTAMVYVQMQALDPSEVRKKLADSEEFDVETMLDEYTEEELEENDPMKKQAEGGGMPGMEGMPGMGGGMPGAEGGAPGGMPGMMPPEGASAEGAPESGEKPKAQQPEGMPAGEKDPMGGVPSGKVQPKADPKKAGVKPELAQGGKPKDTDLGGNAPAAAPAATKLPVDMSGKEQAKANEAKQQLAGKSEMIKPEGSKALPKEPAAKKPEAEKPQEEKNQDAEPEDTLRNAWLGITAQGGEQEGAERIINPSKAPLPGDTLRNAWLGNTPKEEPKEEPEVKKDPADTLRNAWFGVKPEDDTLKRAWHGTEEPEDTLRSAWLGNVPVRPPHGSRLVRTRKGDISIRDYRTASREDEDGQKPAISDLYTEEIVGRDGKRYKAFTGAGYKAYGDSVREEACMDAGAQGAVGVYVIKDGMVLTGVRGAGDGEHLICGPGGHIEEGETPGQAAIRETQEEFGITPMELIPFGKGEKQTNGLCPDLFLCVRYEGTPKCDEEEMHQARFTAIEEIEHSGRLFRPFEVGFQKLVQTITGKNIHADDEQWITVNGTHILIDDEGTAQNGGDLKGMSFPDAESENTTKKVGKTKMPLFQPSKSKLNKELSDIAEKSTSESRRDDQRKVAELLDTLETGSIITVPESSDGDESYRYIKTDSGRWREYGTGESGSWKSGDITDIFLDREAETRAYISKSAKSEEEKEEAQRKHAAKNFRNQDSPWEADKPLLEKAQVTMQKEDLSEVGEGTVIVGKDGRNYRYCGNNDWESEDGDLCDNMTMLSGQKVEGDFFDINFGLNGASQHEVQRLREAYKAMPDEVRAVYEKTLRKTDIEKLQEGQTSYFDPMDGKVYFGSIRGAETFIHEMGHALDDGAVDIEYDTMDGQKIRITSASMNLEHLVPYGGKRAKEDFEAMAKVIGFKTNGDGWFANDEERDNAFKKFMEWGHQQIVQDLSAVSDAVSALTEEYSGGLMFYGGHSRDYWLTPSGGGRASAKCLEYWANYCELKAFGHESELELLKAITPNMYAAAEATYKEAFKK